MPRGLGPGIGISRGRVAAPSPPPPTGIVLSSGVSLVTATGEAASARTRSRSGVSVVTATGEAVSTRTRASSGVSLVTATGEAASLRTRARDGVSLVTATGEAASLRTRASSGVSLVTATGVATSVRTAWNFGQLPGVIAYFQPDVGMLVSQWDDQAGGDDPLIQATTGIQPTKIASALNGYSSLRFNGSNQYMAIADVSDRLDVGTGAFYVYAVVKWLSGQAGYNCFCGKGSSPSNDNWRVMRTSSNFASVYYGSNGANSASFTLPDGAWHLVVWGVQGAANPGILKYYKDGAASTHSNTTNMSAFNGANALSTRLGIDPGGSFASNFEVTEWAFCKGTVHVANDFARAWTYAQSKFAL